MNKTVKLNNSEIEIISDLLKQEKTYLRHSINFTSIYSNKCSIGESAEVKELKLTKKRIDRLIKKLER